MAIPEPYTIQNQLVEFKDLFSSELGLVKNVNVHLEKKETITPKVFKVQPVPYALCEKVDAEVVYLVEVGTGARHHRGISRTNCYF